MRELLRTNGTYSLYREGENYRLIQGVYNPVTLGLWPESGHATAEYDRLVLQEALLTTHQPARGAGKEGEG